MTVPRVVPTLLAALAILTVPLAVVLMPRHAAADPRTDCPAPTPCKVITLTAEEESALLGPKMVLETAVQARQIDLFGIANYFRDKIAKAPAGDAPKAPEKPADPPAQPSGAK